MEIKNSVTHPIVVIVLSILIFDDVNLIEPQYLTIYILEQEFQGLPKILKSYYHRNLFLYSIFWGYFPCLNLMLLIRDRGKLIKSNFLILHWN